MSHPVVKECRRVLPPERHDLPTIQVPVRPIKAGPLARLFFHWYVVEAPFDVHHNETSSVRANLVHHVPDTGHMSTIRARDLIDSSRIHADPYVTVWFRYDQEVAHAYSFL